jgi:hypothetical protein
MLMYYVGFFFILNGEKQYELQILKTTEEDLGVYVCEAQLNGVIIETKVILRLAGKII